MTPPPFYPQKGQNGSKKGKLPKRVVEMGKQDTKEKREEKLKKYFWGQKMSQNRSKLVKKREIIKKGRENLKRSENILKNKEKI